MNEWKEYKLEDITSRIGDGLHGTPKYDVNGKYYFINGNNIGNGWVTIKNDTQKVNAEEYEKHKKPLNDRTLLLSINGTIGNLAYYRDEKCMLGKSACYINLIRDVDIKYIYYNLLSNDFQSYIHNIATGTTIPNVPLKGIRECILKLPPLPTQTSIAEILSSLDDKIDLLHQNNKTLEAMAEAIFRKMMSESGLSGLKDYQDEKKSRKSSNQENQGSDNESEKWKTKSEKLGNVISVKGGTTPSTANSDFWNGSFYWTSPRDLSNASSIFLFDTERKITEKGLVQISSGLLPVGTVLLSSRAPIGYLSITDIPVAINQGYIAIICDKLVSNYFMFLWCKANMETIKNAGNGSVFQEISKSSFKDLDINAPSKEDVKQFHETVSPLFEKIKSNSQQIRTLTQLRDTLLPKLMSGEISLNQDFQDERMNRIEQVQTKNPVSTKIK